MTIESKISAHAAAVSKAKNPADTRQPWQRPQLRQLDASSAEVNTGPAAADGSFTS